MRLAEVSIWNAIYISLYIPVAIIATVIAGTELNPIALLFVGFLCCSILSVYLILQRDILFRRVPGKPETSKGPDQEQKPCDLIAEPNSTPLYRRVIRDIGRPAKTAEVIQPELESEVQPNAKSETEKSTPAKTVNLVSGAEIEPQLLTDADLDDLDADDDESFSKCD